MSSIENRRLRTWDENRGQGKPAWSVILKYGWIRMMRTWWILVPFIVILVLAVIALGSLSYAASSEGGFDYFLLEVTGGLMLGATFVMLTLASSGAFSEDLRFNAPLFFFSRPIGPDAYLYGKLAQAATLVAVVAIIPMLAMLSMATFAGLTSEPIDWNGQALRGQELAEWHFTHVDTAADAAYVWAFFVPGWIVSLAFLVALYSVLSVYTRRAWHTAIAVLVTIGGTTVLGASASPLLDGALRNLVHPMGWIESVTRVPIGARFSYGLFWRDHGAIEYYETATTAVVIAYVLLIASTIGMVMLTRRRIRHTEALL